MDAFRSDGAGWLRIELIIDSIYYSSDKQFCIFITSHKMFSYLFYFCLVKTCAACVN